jgi:F-type H+-transporting ATPase subunit gamma
VRPLDSNEGKFSQQREVKKVLLVPIVSNRGLAGAFNTQVFRLMRKALSEASTQGVEVSILPIGKKAMDMYRRSGKLDESLPTDLAGLYEGLNFDKVAPVAELIMSAFVEGRYDRVVLFYNKFKNAAVQITTEEQYLPIPPAAEKVKGEATKGEHIMEPDRATIVEQIIPKSLKIQLYKALLDSNAAEHGARMTAMHKATDNADSLIKELKLSYNKARQAAITGEILEIVGGAEALKG